MFDREIIFGVFLRNKPGIAQVGAPLKVQTKLSKTLCSSRKLS